MTQEMMPRASISIMSPIFLIKFPGMVNRAEVAFVPPERLARAAAVSAVPGVLSVTRVLTKPCDMISPLSLLNRQGANRECRRHTARYHQWALLIDDPRAR